MLGFEVLLRGTPDDGDARQADVLRYNSIADQII